MSHRTPGTQYTVQLALLSVGADIWFSPRAESGDELRPFDHNHKVVSANAHLTFGKQSKTAKSFGKQSKAAKTFGKQSKAANTFGKQSKATKTFGKQSKSTKRLTRTVQSLRWPCRLHADLS